MNTETQLVGLQLNTIQVLFMACYMHTHRQGDTDEVMCCYRKDRRTEIP
jgi:hypothetical protein